MSADDRGLHGVASGAASAPPGEREHAIRQVAERIAAAAAQRAAPPAPHERRRDARPPAPIDDGATLRSPPVWIARPAGAERGPAPVPGHHVGPPASQPPMMPARAFPERTTPLPALSPEALAKLSALPFQPAPTAQPPTQRRAAPRTVQSRLSLGGTTPVGDDSIEKARGRVSSQVPFPPLTLRQVASLCAELAFQPERRREILERYQVHGDAAYAALDAHWSRERAARPEMRTAFADDYATHLAWLHAQARRA